MKRPILLLTVFLLVAVGIYWAFQGTERSESLADAVSPDLLRDASQGGSMDEAGPAWPDDSVMAALRKDWSALSPSDSTLLDGLTMEWIHPEHKLPKQFVTAPQIKAGESMSLKERLRVGSLLAEHPHWRTGVMRNFPALAGVIGPLEKNVLLLTSRGARTASEMARSLGVSATAVQTTARAWVAVGWLEEQPLDGGSRYQAVDKRVTQGGALEFVTVKYRRGDPKHFVTLESAVQTERESLKSQWVTFSGICPQTGKALQVVLAAGRLRSGKPSSVYTARVEQLGHSAGFFADETAYQEWSQEHPHVLGEGRSAVNLFKEVLAES